MNVVEVILWNGKYRHEGKDYIVKRGNLMFWYFSS